MAIQTLYTPSFTGYKTVFSKKLEKAVAAKKTTSASASRLLDDFADMYSKRIRMENKIGSGFYGTVYKIDNSYVLKKGNELLIPEFGGIEVVRKPKFAHLKHYFGEAIAKIYNNKGEDILILKNVYSKGKSIPVGIPDSYGRNHTRMECFEYYAKEYLPKFAKLPQRSFDGVAKDFALLNKMCTPKKSYFFDFLNPNNFVLCGKTIRIIDEINVNTVRTKNTVTDMLEVFLNRIDLDNEAIFDEKLIPLRKEMVKKIILAGVKHNLPICHRTEDLSAWLKTFNDILGMGNMDVGELTSDINNIAHMNIRVKQRLEIAKEYIEKVLEG